MCPCFFPVLTGLLLVLLAAGPCRCRKAEVSSGRQLHAALADAAVSEVVLLHGGSFNLTPADFPTHITLRRAVTLRGQLVGGAGPHIHANRLMMVVEVAAGGALLQHDFSVADCIIDRMPLFCFSHTAQGGHVESHGLTLADASCTATKDSLGIAWFLQGIRGITGAEANTTQLDDRTLVIHDTGNYTLPHGASIRFVNTTLTCTGTPARPLQAGADGGTPAAHLLAVAVTAAAGLAGALYWWRQAGGRQGAGLEQGCEELPEVAAARARGIVLERLIGRGTFGRVFLARYHGKPVAVKVLEFAAGERAAQRRVSRECQLSTSCQHPNIVAYRQHFTVNAAVLRRTAWRQQQLPGFDGSSDATHYWEPSYVFEATQSAAAAASPPFHPEDTPATASLRASSYRLAAAAGMLRAASALSPPSPDSATPSTATTGGTSGSSSEIDGGTGGGTAGGTGEVTLHMTYIVMEYCPGGTLQQAIQRGTFTTRRAKRGASPGLNVEAILRTALDISRALTHLHTRLALVHRDLSASNVLLKPDSSDPRGFKALLADFGLSTLLQQQGTATSHLKGTAAFMPPELFVALPKIELSLDVYSLGIVVYCMCCGGPTPYAGQSPYQVVAAKMEEASRRRPLPLPTSIPECLHAFIWSCTHHDQQLRWGAQDAAAYLQGLLAAL